MDRTDCPKDSSLYSWPYQAEQSCELPYRFSYLPGPNTNRTPILSPLPSAGWILKLIVGADIYKLDFLLMPAAVVSCGGCVWDPSHSLGAILRQTCLEWKTETLTREVGQCNWTYIAAAEHGSSRSLPFPVMEDLNKTENILKNIYLGSNWRN